MVRRSQSVIQLPVDALSLADRVSPSGRRLVSKPDAGPALMKRISMAAVSIKQANLIRKDLISISPYIDIENASIHRGDRVQVL